MKNIRELALAAHEADQAAAVKEAAEERATAHGNLRRMLVTVFRDAIGGALPAGDSHVVELAESDPDYPLLQKQESDLETYRPIMVVEIDGLRFTWAGSRGEVGLLIYEDGPQSATPVSALCVTPFASLANLGRILANHAELVEQVKARRAGEEQQQAAILGSAEVRRALAEFPAEARKAIAMGGGDNSFHARVLCFYLGRCAEALEAMAQQEAH